MIGGDTELSLGHVLEIRHLDDGVDTARLELEERNAFLHDLHSPSEEPIQAFFVAKNAVVKLLVLENSVSIVANRVIFRVLAVKIGDHAFQLLEAQVLFQDLVGGEVPPPFKAAEEHFVGVRGVEVPSPEELEEDDVCSLVAEKKRDPPEGWRRGYRRRREESLQLFERLLLRWP